MHLKVLNLPAADPRMRSWRCCLSGCVRGWGWRPRAGGRSSSSPAWWSCCGRGWAAAATAASPGPRGAARSSRYRAGGAPAVNVSTRFRGSFHNIWRRCLSSAFSLLKMPTCTFTLMNLWRHYYKQRNRVDMKLGRLSAMFIGEDLCGQMYQFHLFIIVSFNRLWKTRSRC